MARLAWTLLSTLALTVPACGGDDTVTTAGTSDETSEGSDGSTAAPTTDTTDGGATAATSDGTGATAGTTASPTTSDPSTASTDDSDSDTSDATDPTQTDSDASTDTDTDTDTDTEGQVECVYPITWPADPASEATFAEALAALSPGATYTWDADRGTVYSIQSLEVAFDCPDGTPLWDAVFAFFEAHPAIFQMAGEQWHLGPSETQCQHVKEMPKLFNTSRKQLGDWAVFRDVVHVRLYRDADDNVVMQSMGGVYVPRMPEAIHAQIVDCLANGPAMEALEQAMYDESFPYVSYLNAQQICVPTIMGSYDAAPLDAINFTGDAQVDWYEAGDASVTVTVAQRVELVVDPQNVTDELAASNAACPKEMEPGTVVGFYAYLDLIEAIVLSKGAGLGCIVC